MSRARGIDAEAHYANDLAHQAALVRLHRTERIRVSRSRGLDAVAEPWREPVETRLRIAREMRDAGERKRFAGRTREGARADYLCVLALASAYLMRDDADRWLGI